MERLQTAIQKARADREVGARLAGTDPAAAPPLRTTPPAAGAVGYAGADDPREALWLALPQVERTTGQRPLRLTTVDPSAEAAPFDLLRTRLLQITQPQGWKRIAVVSAQAGAGKTTVTANLAFSLSRQEDVRTIAMDFDMRRPNLAPTLGVRAPETGMVEMLRGEVPFTAQARRAGRNVAFALNGQPARHTAELLQSRRALDRIEAIERDYAPDFLLFDLPPVFGSDDSIGFLRHVDAVLIVAEAEKTPLKQLDLLERQVAELSNVIGVVLNKCHYKEAIYGSQYGYY